MTEVNEAGLTPAIRDCLERMNAFANGYVALNDFYGWVDLFEDRVRNMDPACLEARGRELAIPRRGGLVAIRR